jgi:outer membrane protein OmpA-like peptidoglycan-associated protein
MAIERDDTYGDMDLYVSFQYVDGNWSEPMNMGPAVNTAAAEASVFLAADGKTIYFSSMGHPGYGGFDMYMSRRLDNSWRNWSEPLNLGFPFNTPLDDYYYTIPASGDFAYYSSNDNSYGKSDIFRIPLPYEIRPEPVTMIKANVIASAPTQQIPQVGKQPVSQPVQQAPVTLVIPKDNPGALVQNFPGYYPVEKSAPETTKALLEEDKAKNLQSIKQTPQQAQLNQLQDRLQQLKNEQAEIEQKMEQQLGQPVSPVYSQQVVPKNTTPTTPVPPAGNQVSELDARLAELRSQMEQLKNNPSAYKPIGTPTTPAALSPAYPNPVHTPAYQGQSQQQQVDPYQQQLQQYQQSYEQQGYPQQPQRIYYVPEKPQPKPYQEPSMPGQYNTANATLEELKAQRDALSTTSAPMKTSKIKVDREDPNIRYDPAPLPATPSRTTSPELKSYEEKLQKLRDGLKEYETSASEPSRILTMDTLSIPVSPVQSVSTPAHSNVAPATTSQLPQQDLSDLPGLSQEIAGLQQHKDALSQNKEQLENDTRHLSEEKAMLEAQRKQLEDMIAAMEAERTKLAEERLKMQEERDRLQQQKEQQAREVIQLERQIEQLAQNKLKTQAELQKAKQQAQEYEVRSEDIILMPVEKGAVIQVNNIFFNANAIFLKQESYRELNKIAVFLKSNPGIVVEIGGHTNGLCDDDFCLYLSDGRARAVRDYIVSQGVPSGRITFKGYGKQFPIADNSTTEGRLRNQRVEMKIVEVH